MYVACSTLCFTRMSLEDALKSIREMHFNKADLAIHHTGPHLTPAEVLSDTARCAQRIKASNVPVAAFHVRIEDCAGANGRQELRAICRLGRLLSVPVLTIPTVSVGMDLDHECSRLMEWSRICTMEGVILSVETRAMTLTGDPEVAAELCRRVPGLGLTLDPTHYLVGFQTDIDYDHLFPFVRHVRLRDSGRTNELFQVRVGRGDLEYGRIVTQLERYRYDRALTVDIQDIPDSSFPVEPEVRKLKYLLESLV